MASWNERPLASFVGDRDEILDADQLGHEGCTINRRGQFVGRILGKFFAFVLVNQRLGACWRRGSRTPTHSGRGSFVSI